MKRTKIIWVVLGLITQFSIKGSGQVSGIAKAGYSYNALNATAKSATVKQNLVSASNGIKINGAIQSPAAQAAVSQAAGVILAANQSVILSYGVPDRVMLDRILLGIGIQKRIAALIDIQDNYRSLNLPNDVKNKVIQIYQDDINNLQSIWDALSTTCAPVSFKNYSAHVNADIKYKDVLSGVGLIRAENGIANFTNISYSEIEGQTKATELIYRK